jgi:single-strand DNA-binding protein
MAKGLNKAEIIGRLGQDPDIRYTQSGTAVANMSVATNHSIKRNDEWEEQTEWHRVIAWAKLAEICGEYLMKGSQVYISGRLQTRSWDDKDGVKRWATEIVAQDVIFLDSKGQGQKSDRPPAPPDDDEDGSGQSGGYNASEENKGDEEFGGMEGDVPF